MTRTLHRLQMSMRDHGSRKPMCMFGIDAGRATDFTTHSTAHNIMQKPETASASRQRYRAQGRIVTT